MESGWFEQIWMQLPREEMGLGDPQTEDTMHKKNWHLADFTLKSAQTNRSRLSAY